ncbi:hypothetical protein ORJ04_05000 [Rheinheimera baltica]|uniref:Uncharacterized protein n=1 Tax=Rheinheimera baltica TaxID=67576 RepID=A0ABT9HW01_9GAMM|nr:hypothetical protein [Rheinheimera baltica]MDP5135308.1 hypothetical protein [Rheinheimera baltica]
MSKVLEPITAMFGIFANKNKANKVYTHLLPSLEFVMTVKGPHSAEARGLIAILGGLPASGVKSLNFAKLYLKEPNAWKNLPKDPNDIPFGHWH